MIRLEDLCFASSALALTIARCEQSTLDADMYRGPFDRIIKLIDELAQEKRRTGIAFANVAVDLQDEPSCTHAPEAGEK